MMKTGIAIVAAVCFMTAWLSCSTDMSGGSTESTNQRTANTVYEPDGITPAESAIVVIRSQNTLAAIAGVTTEQPGVTSDTAVTDEHGKYAFDNILGDGLYSFEATKDGNAVFVNPVNVAGGESLLEIDPVTVKPAGCITGKIHLAEGGDPTEVYVLALGIDRFARVNSNGTFTFGSLGEGIYYLKIITILDNYGAFDTAWITVYPGRTTDIGTIALPFSGIGVPQNVTVTYNPDLQEATIRWNKVTRPGVKYYNLYRGHGTYSATDFHASQTIRLNTYLVTDTVFIDTAIVGLGRLPEAVAYSISVVDSAENEGEKSPAVIVKTTQSIAIINNSSSMSLPMKRMVDFAIARNGDIYVACDNAPYLSILDSAFNYKGEFKVPKSSNTDSSAAASAVPTCICLDETAGLVYVARSGNSGIIVFDFAGALIDTINDPAILALGVIDCEMINNSLHVLAGGDSVISFDGNGKRKAAWRVDKGQCLANGGGGQVVMGAYKQLCRYDTAGNLLYSKPMTAVPNSIAIDTTKQHLFILTGVAASGSFLVKEYDNTSVLISQYVNTKSFFTSTRFRQTILLQGNGNPVVLYDFELIRLRALKN